MILEQEIPTHSHDHMHPHVHRSWAGIEKMLLEADLKPRVKDLSLQMFHTVAEAEAKVHGKSIDEVHFHEVGCCGFYCGYCWNCHMSDGVASR